jgi:hypothetical protein
MEAQRSADGFSWQIKGATPQAVQTLAPRYECKWLDRSGLDYDRAFRGERNPARLLDGALSRSKTDVERDRLEKALEEGLRETFPASDAVAVVQHAHRDLGRTQAFDWDGLQNRLARHTSLINFLPQQQIRLTQERQH